MLSTFVSAAVSCIEETTVEAGSAIGSDYKISVFENLILNLILTIIGSD